MNIIKEVEITLMEIKEKSIEETETYINERIAGFKKTKNIKYYLQSLIVALNNELKVIMNNYSSLKCNEQKKQLNHFKDILRKLTVIKGIYKKYRDTKNTKIINTLEPEYDYSQFEFDLETANIKDVISIYKDMIKNGNFDLNQDKFIEYATYLNNVFIEELEAKIDYTNDISSIMDALKSRVSNYPLDSLQRNFFKNIYKQFKSTIHLYNKRYEVNSRDQAYFEILKYYVERENYFVIQELLKRKPEVCNIRYNNEHILFYILDLYNENLKNHLENKEAINISYIKELYLLFTKSEGFRISYEERQAIDKYLNEIASYAKTTIVKEKRRNHVLKELKQMRPTNFYRKAFYEYEEISMDKLTYEKQAVLNNVCNHAEKMITEGYEVLPAFVVGNTAYTLIENDKEIILKMHVMNISPYISNNSLLKQYAHKFVYNNEDSDKDFILKGCRYQEDKKYDVITYSLSFYLSGKIKHLNVEQNVIDVTNKYLTLYDKNEETNNFMQLYNKSIYKNGGEYEFEDVNKINKHFESLLNNLYPVFLKRHKIPFIYYGYSKPDESILLENKNALLIHLCKMDRNDALEILNIITSRIDKWHYTLYPMDNAVYDLKLINNFNYLGIENMRMLNEFYFNSHLVNMQRLEQNKKICYQDLDELVKEFNSYINYVDVNSLTKHHHKILRRQKF